MNEIINFLKEIKQLLNDIKTLLEEQRPAMKKESGRKKQTEKMPDTVEAVFRAYTDNEKLLKSLLDFADMRKKARSPLTVRAAEMQLRTLDELAKTTADKITLVERSTMNGWKSIYPLPGSFKSGTVKQTTFNNYEQREEDYDEIERRIMEQRIKRKGV